MKESTIRIPTLLGGAPALVIRRGGGQQRFKGCVLVYHGLGANKEVQRPELTSLAAAGFVAVGVDAPHHGERQDGRLDRLASAAADPHYEVMRIVDRAASEIPAIVSFCLRSYPGCNVGVSGISLGGFIAYGAVVADSRIKACVPIIGSPDWSSTEGPNSREMQKLLPRSPVNFPDRFAPCALLAANAGKDTSVPPQAARKFCKTLKSYYNNGSADRLQYIEYPESEHLMRESDWKDLWRQTLAWFEQYLR